MSNREVDRLRVIRTAMSGALTWNEAGRQLSLSERTIGRLCAQVRAEGNKGIIHGLRGRPSNNRLAPGIIELALSTIKEHYPDFHPTFANEKLREHHGIILSVPTLRRAMIAEGLWRGRKSKTKHRDWRERRACVGELVQLDGSEHDWFEGRGPCCALLIFIDDATSRILFAVFITVEDTDNLLRSTGDYLRAHGRPAAFYVDKDSIYKVNRQASIDEELRDAQPITQFTRAMGELGIEVITANSPQAKGRVERGFKTHQDRLVKELRLAGISTMAEANKFLREVYVPLHNAKYAVAPRNAADAHRPLLRTHNLDEILSVRTERIIGNDYTVRLQNKFYQILADQSVRIRPKDSVLFETRLDGTLHLCCKGEYLDFKELPERPHKGYYADKKVSGDTRSMLPHKPPKDHPWRKWRPAGQQQAPF